MTPIIVALSDLHGLHKQPHLMAVPPGDILVCAGDIELRSKQQFDFFVAWLAGQPHKHKVVTLGNMDAWGEHASASDFEAAARRGVHIVIDQAVELGGLRFLGSPATPKFYGAFQLDGDAEGVRHWEHVLPPDTDVDVLITHGPPLGYGDQTRGRHVGDKLLLAAVQRLQRAPRLWVCGHIHEGRGVYHVPHPQGEILLVNAAVEHIKRGHREMQPWIVDLDKPGDVRAGPPPDTAASTAAGEAGAWTAPEGGHA